MSRSGRKSVLKSNSPQEEVFIDSQTNICRVESTPQSVSSPDSTSNRLTSVTAAVMSKGKRYFCTICNKSYTKRQRVVLHMHKCHNGEQLFSCDVCENEFEIESALQKHIGTMHRNFLFCDQCCKKLSSEEKLLEHQKRFHCDKTSGKGMMQFTEEAEKTRTAPGVKPMETRHSICDKRKHRLHCSECKKSFANKTTLRQHEKKYHEIPSEKFNNESCASGAVSEYPASVDQRGGTEDSTEDRFNCRLCGRAFSVQDQLSSHLVLCHSYVTCSGCIEVFPHVDAQTKHKEQCHPEISLNCSFCPKIFQTREATLSHMTQFHAGIRCRICKQWFSGRGSIIKHMNICGRAGVRIHKCQLCGIQCTDFTSLSTHMKACHFTETFQCRICSKVLESLADRSAHERSCAAVTKCTICSKTFYTNADLSRHVAKSHLKCNICGNENALSPHACTSHHGEKSLVCTQCNQKFKYAHVLKAHMIVMHGKSKDSTKKTTYKCQICSKDFEHDHSLQMHIKTHGFGKQLKCGVCSEMFAKITKHIELFHCATSEKKNVKQYIVESIIGASGEQSASSTLREEETMSVSSDGSAPDANDDVAKTSEDCSPQIASEGSGVHALSAGFSRTVAGVDRHDEGYISTEVFQRAYQKEAVTSDIGDIQSEGSKDPSETYDMLVSFLTDETMKTDASKSLQTGEESSYAAVTTDVHANLTAGVVDMDLQHSVHHEDINHDGHLQHGVHHEDSSHDGHLQHSVHYEDSSHDGHLQHGVHHEDISHDGHLQHGVHHEDSGHDGHLQHGVHHEDNSHDVHLQHSVHHEDNSHDGHLQHGVHHEDGVHDGHLQHSASLFPDSDQNHHQDDLHVTQPQKKLESTEECHSRDLSQIVGEGLATLNDVDPVVRLSPLKCSGIDESDIYSALRNNDPNGDVDMRLLQPARQCGPSRHQSQPDASTEANNYNLDVKNGSWPDDGMNGDLKNGDSRSDVKNGDSRSDVKNGDSRSDVKNGDSLSDVKNGDSLSGVKNDDSHGNVNNVDMNMTNIDTGKLCAIPDSVDGLVPLLGDIEAGNSTSKDCVPSYCASNEIQTSEEPMNIDLMVVEPDAVVSPREPVGATVQGKDREFSITVMEELVVHDQPVVDAVKMSGASDKQAAETCDIQSSENDETKQVHFDYQSNFQRFCENTARGLISLSEDDTNSRSEHSPLDSYGIAGYISSPECQTNIGIPSGERSTNRMKSRRGSSSYSVGDRRHSRVKAASNDASKSMLSNEHHPGNEHSPSMNDCDKFGEDIKSSDDSGVQAERPTIARNKDRCSSQSTANVQERSPRAYSERQTTNAHMEGVNMHDENTFLISPKSLQSVSLITNVEEVFRLTETASCLQENQSKQTVVTGTEIVGHSSPSYDSPQMANGTNESQMCDLGQFGSPLQQVPASNTHVQRDSLTIEPSSISDGVSQVGQTLTPSLHVPMAENVPSETSRNRGDCTSEGHQTPSIDAGTSLGPPQTRESSSMPSVSQTPSFSSLRSNPQHILTENLTSSNTPDTGHQPSFQDSSLNCVQSVSRLQRFNTTDVLAPMNRRKVSASRHKSSKYWNNGLPQDPPRKKCIQFTCGLCQALFPTVEALNQHKLMKHSLRCTQCGNTYTRMMDLIDHYESCS